MTEKCVLRAPNESEEKRKAVCLEQLAVDRQNLLMRWPFIGGIILRMELVAVRDDRLQTASTDGNTIFTDIDFYAGLSREERLFVLAHEVWHCVFLHFMRRGRRDRELFNIAADLEIHFALREEKMKEPFVLPHDPGWAGLSAEEIYERLENQVQDQTQAKSDAKDSKWKNGRFDRHLYPGGAGSEEAPEGGEDGESSKDGEENKGGKGGELVIDRDYAPGTLSSDTAERVRGRVIASAQQVERRQGTLPGGLALLLEQLRKPELPWQELLKRFVVNCYGGSRRWLPPARRHVWQGLYLPSMRSERLKAVVALDTSGSTADDLSLFFGELTSLIRSFGRYELTVIQCDARVQKVESFTDTKPLPANYPWEAKGFGGTSFVPVFEYVKEHQLAPDLLLYFTDGYGNAPAKAPVYPVMWVLTEKDGLTCSWGERCYFKKQEKGKK